MRSCRPFASPSSRDDVQETQLSMDESITPASILQYESALVRSEDEKHVLHALDYLANNGSLKEHDQKVQTVYLKVLALYRLRHDDECLMTIKKSEAEGITSPEITAIKDALSKEIQKKKTEETAVAVGIGSTIVLGIAAIVGAVLFGKRKSK
ncbi:hypothetical protein TRFO_08305 [Tritrichomonas foetus]|uniref:Mitochondrial fission 1 protein n=1 Tax=Tritrichomonas foetus TaxID=1144522 RepID=A0A1J4JMK9_9EUKA|nr:hypothetical protein TRFO_08305 [Tritrichomonas foetus]|eukprot:OHS99671.1 hypothetical protein TRFO_08305 [Tritrichomonas foetus]